jgi:hypothetical protein
VNAQYAGINFHVLTHLTSLGLIEFTALNVVIGCAEAEIAPSYGDRVHQLKFDGGAEWSFPIGQVRFTQAGLELFSISNAIGSESIETAALDAWSANGWKKAESIAEVQQPSPSDSAQDTSLAPVPTP